MQPQQIRAKYFRLQHHFHHKQKQQQLAHRCLSRTAGSSCCCCWLRCQLHFRVLNLLLKESVLCRDCVAGKWCWLAGRRLPLVISPLGAFTVCDCAILFRCISMLAEMVGIVSGILLLLLLFLFVFFAIFVFSFCNFVFCFDINRIRLLSVRFSRLV